MIILQKFQDLEVKISDLGDDLKSHISKENLRQIKNNALAQMEAVQEKLVYIEEFRGKEVREYLYNVLCTSHEPQMKKKIFYQLSGEAANVVDRHIAALSNTQISALSKTNFEDICIDTFPYEDDKLQVEREYCATLVYTYLMIEEDRYLIMFELLVI